jgi:histidinol-phosphatase (PHP family)
MIVDYHIHAPYCGHAQGKTIEYVQSAIAHKVNQAGFSDHLGRYYLSGSQQKRYWNWGMDEDKIPRYIEELMALRDVYQSRIDIRIGLEVDYIEGAEDALATIINKYPFDFIIGSVHCIPQFGWQHLSDIPATDPTTLYNAYFETVAKALKCGLFQSVAHVDFIWRYIKWPQGNPSFVFDHIEQLCKIAGDTSTAIEINVNGYLWSQTNQIEEQDPFTFLINQIRHNAVMVTLGSDAHTPKHVAKNFDQIIPYLHDLGIRSVATFKNKRMNLVPLSITK